MKSLLTVREVAGIFKVTEATIREWIRTERLVGCKTGKSWRIREEDMQKALVGKTSTTNNS